MRYSSKTILAGLAATCLALSGGALAQAQGPAPAKVETPRGATTVEGLQALNKAAATVALGSEPIAPEQLALSARLLKAMNLRATTDEITGLVLASTREQIAQSVAGKPPAQKDKFLAAVDEALGSLKTEMVDRKMAGLTRYYAARLTMSQLADAVALYENPLVAKSLRAADSLTEAEQQELGLLMPKLAVIADVVGAAAGSMEVSQTLAVRENATLGERFKTRLCAGLKTRGMSSPACPA